MDGCLKCPRCKKDQGVIIPGAEGDAFYCLACRFTTMDVANTDRLYDLPERRAKAMDLFLAFDTDADFFRAMVYKLFYKADAANLQRLYRAYPTECELYHEWEASPTAKEFFERYRVGELLRGEPKRVYYYLYVNVRPENCSHKFKNDGKCLRCGTFVGDGELHSDETSENEGAASDGVSGADS